MRNNFNLQLNELHEDLKKMGTLCEDCITFATQSLLLGDTELGERAIQAEKQTDIMEKRNSKSLHENSFAAAAGGKRS